MSYNTIQYNISNMLLAYCNTSQTLPTPLRVSVSSLALARRVSVRLLGFGVLLYFCLREVQQKRQSRGARRWFRFPWGPVGPGLRPSPLSRKREGTAYSSRRACRLPPLTVRLPHSRWPDLAFDFAARPLGAARHIRGQAPRTPSATQQGGLDRSKLSASTLPGCGLGPKKRRSEPCPRALCSMGYYC